MANKLILIAILIVLWAGSVWCFDLQKAIDDAGTGTLYLPVGEIEHTGIVISKSVTIIGAGWNWDGTVLRNIGSGPNITINNPVMTGAKLTNIMLTGKGDGLVVCSEGNNLAERIYILNHEGRGVVFHPDCNTSLFSLIGSRIQGSGGDAIYGRTRTGAQLNALTIRGTHIGQNYSNGINVFAYLLWMSENVIQGNAGHGIILPMSATNAYVDALRASTYFEANKVDIVRSWK